MKILRPYEPPFEYLNELVDSLVTEDDEPVDQFTSANRDLLISVLYTSWVPSVERAIDQPRQFFACGNVGVFPSVRQPPLVPDVLLSMDVTVEGSLHDKRNAAYFLWEFGKPPDVVVEIVDDEKGEELSRIMSAYERIRVTYYVVYDPRQLLSDERLQVFELRGGKYRRQDDCILPEIGLGLIIWEGEHHFIRAPWLRWCDDQGNLLLTGNELAALRSKQLDRH